MAVTTHSTTRRSVDVGFDRGASRILVAVLASVVGLLGWWFVGTADDVVSGKEPTSGDSASEPPQPDAATRTESVRPPPDRVDVARLPVGDITRRPELALLLHHRIFVSDSTGLHDIDTDTGAVESHRRSVVPGSLLGRYRDQLILVDDQRRVVAVPADDPSLEPLLVLDVGGSASRSSIQQARMIDDHRLVVGAWTFTEPFSSGLDRIVIDLERRTVANQSTTGAQLDDLTWVAGGGLFEITDDGYRYLADGTPVVAGRNHVLVHECDGPGDCGRRWIDRRTAEPIDRPMPAENNWQLEFIDFDDRVLFVNGDDGHRYFDAVHGWLLPDNIIRGTGGDYFDHPAEAVVGGRILLAPTVDGIVAYDLDTHAAYLLDLGDVEPRGVTSIVAVPKFNLRETAS